MKHVQGGKAKRLPPHGDGWHNLDMPDYRQNRAPGGTYFFTVNLLELKSDLLVRHIDVFRGAIEHVRRSRPFHIDAWVVLPDHMHCIWSLHEGDDNYSRVKKRNAKIIANNTLVPIDRGRLMGG